jgi:hypothetical protein
MKKTLKPIRLQRETLQNLAEGKLGQARTALGEGSNYISCPHPHTCLAC